MWKYSTVWEGSRVIWQVLHLLAPTKEMPASGTHHCTVRAHIISRFLSAEKQSAGSTGAHRNMSSTRQSAKCLQLILLAEWVAPLQKSYLCFTRSNTQEVRSVLPKPPTQPPTLPALCLSTLSYSTFLPSLSLSLTHMLGSVPFNTLHADT